MNRHVVWAVAVDWARSVTSYPLQVSAVEERWIPSELDELGGHYTGTVYLDGAEPPMEHLIEVATLREPHEIAFTIAHESRHASQLEWLVKALGVPKARVVWAKELALPYGDRLTEKDADSYAHEQWPHVLAALRRMDVDL